MKRFYFVTLFIAFFISHILNAQLNQFVEVEHLPETQRIKKQKTGFIYNESMDSVAWGYRDKKDKLKIVQTLNKEFEQLMAVEIWAGFHNDTIVFNSRYPTKATVRILYFKWDGKKLIFLNEGYYDPNEEPLKKAEEALSKGNIKEAIEWYSSIQYPYTYLNEGEVAGRILSKANQMAYFAGVENRAHDAVQFFDDAFDYYYISNFDPDVFSFQNEYDEYLVSHNLIDYKDSLKTWLTAYGYQLYLKGDLKKSILVNTFLTKRYARNVQPYLVLADSYFEDRQSNEAKTAYKEYVAVMRELGMERYVPTRAFDRSR